MTGTLSHAEPLPEPAVEPARARAVRAGEVPGAGPGSRRGSAAGPSRAAPSPVDDLTGLVRWVLDIPTEPGEPTIFNASVKMAATTVYSEHPCYDNNGGSGLTAQDARGAALGEGLERYCCSVYDHGDHLVGSYDEVSRTHPAVRPDDLALFRPHVGTAPGTAPGTAHARDVPLAWVWAWRPLARSAVLVPACLVYMPYFPGTPDEVVLAPAVSTGLACAATVDDAVLRGVCEAVERDAFMITWMNRLPVPRVDLTSHPRLRRVYEERLARDGLEYLLVRTTTDLGVPSFLCVLLDHRRSPTMISVGGAAGLDPVRAATKAMTEAVQTREWGKFLGGPEGRAPFAAEYDDVRDFEDHVRLYAYGDMEHAVEFLRTGPLVGVDEGVPAGSSTPTTGPRSVAADLATVLGRLDDAGLDVLTLDLTTTDVAEAGYRVARTIVPQLQPLDADHRLRFLGGRRLYEAPVRMGYRTAPSTVADLNPVPHPYP
ncbi:YcaO-like family protein [Cellulomonas sp. 179-A 4D5 NHS]|uniref:YcaO-like family protein n=1 Tax=Cellulomonas sp. 179-A 4D5 NHS TaxID=3142378 RepID=UPI0039A2F4EC